MLRQLKAVFAPVPLGEAELMADPQTTWTRLLGDIAEARREVLIENYILLDGDAADALLSALAAAAERGARIRVTIDGAGSYQLSARLRRRLDEVGELRIYHPLRFGALFGGLHTRLLRRTHRRLVVIDGTIGWTVGIAVEDPWWPAPGRVAVRDTMARVTGEPAAQLQAAFDQLWREELPAPEVIVAPIGRVVAGSDDEQRILLLPINLF